MTTDNLRHDAEKKITEILAELECKTGCKVEGLSIRSLETSSIDSDGAEYMQRASIDLSQPIGSTWDLS